jgi:hypothetical protein
MSLNLERVCDLRGIVVASFVPFLLALAMAFSLVPLQYRACRHFRSSLAVAPDFSELSLMCLYCLCSLALTPRKCFCQALVVLPPKLDVCHVDLAPRCTFHWS